MISFCRFAALAALLVFTMGPLARPGAAQAPAQDVTAAMQGQLGEQVLDGCNTELARFCAEVTPEEGRLLACLYAHGDKLSNQCDYALHTAAARLERAISAITYVASECRAELEIHCAEIAAGEGRMSQCLKDHASDLGPGCDQALTEVGVK
jgi:Cysteine rich repeat